MAAALTDDQIELRKNVRFVLAAESSTTITREAYLDPERWRGVWKNLVDLGWTSLALGDEDSGLGLMELLVVLEECGAATLSAPLLASVGHAAGALLAVEGAAPAELAAVAAGTVSTLVVGSSQAPDAGLDLVAGRLTGVVRNVVAAPISELFVALARDEESRWWLATFPPGPGVDAVATHSVDPSRPLAELTVDVAPASVYRVRRESVLARPLLSSAAELVGVAERALSLSVGHAKIRVQFGQPIGAFQAVKHRLADVYVSIERARSLVYAAADRILSGEDSQAWGTVLLAKAAAAEAASQATRAGVAVHGAIAQTWEHDMHLLVRRAWQGGVLMGETEALYVEAGRRFLTEVGG